MCKHGSLQKPADSRNGVSYTAATGATASDKGEARNRGYVNQSNCDMRRITMQVVDLHKASCAMNEVGHRSILDHDVSYIH